MAQYAVLGIGAEAWVELEQVEADAQKYGTTDSTHVSLRWATLRVVMRVLRVIRLEDFRDLRADNERLTAALETAQRENEKLRGARRIHELDNHHNAALCPYCTPDLEKMRAAQRETVICAAVRLADGYIVRGHRHPDAMESARGIPRYAETRITQEMQGFITSRNRFVSRKEAADLWRADHPAFTGDTLFSEDVY